MGGCGVEVAVDGGVEEGMILKCREEEEDHE